MLEVKMLLKWQDNNLQKCPITKAVYFIFFLCSNNISISLWWQHMKQTNLINLKEKIDILGKKLFRFPAELNMELLSAAG